LQEQRWKERGSSPIQPKKTPPVNLASREYLNLPMGKLEGKYKRIKTPVELRLQMLAEIDAMAPVPQEMSAGEAELRYREGRLRAVFKEFDLDGGGTIGKEELMELGKARRRLGQKQGRWSENSNRRMMARMDKDGDGEVAEAEFVTFFNSYLPGERPEFVIIMEQFMLVATAVRSAKIAGQPWGTPGGLDSAASSPATSPRSPVNMATTPIPGDRGDTYLKHRRDALAKVFDEFDLDGSSKVESNELFKLGTARRTLGQKTGKWSENSNERLITKMDKDGDGDIDREEFVTHFEQMLARERFEFDSTMEQFMQVAKACRKEKKAARDSEARKKAASDRIVTPNKLGSGVKSKSPASREYGSPWPKGGLSDPMMEVTNQIHS